MSGSAPAALRKLEKGCRSLPRQFVDDAVAKGRKVVQKQARSATGGDMVLSNAGGRLSVKTKVSGDTVVEGEIVAGPSRQRAQWFWLEDGTNPHPMGRGTHPGTSGKRVWSKAVDPLIPQLVDDAGQRFRKVVG